MIKSIVTQEGAVIVEASLVRPPAIYLDQDSIHDFAEPKPRRQRFLDIFQRKGTLLFSWTNAMDIAGPTGNTKREIRDFLEAIGPYWIPLEMNPYKVARKEQSIESARSTPCVSESFLQSYCLNVKEPRTLAQVIDLVHEERDHIRANTELIKKELCQTVSGWALEYSKNQSCLDQMLPPEPWNSVRPTTFVLRELERLIVKEAKSHKWMPDDGVDFMHAAVAGACADLLVLDKQWKRRILRVAPPRMHPWVFYRYELDQFIDVFEKCGGEGHNPAATSETNSSL